MKKEDLNRRARIAIKAAHEVTYPFRDIKEGTLRKSNTHIRRQVAQKVQEWVSSRAWTYAGTDYSVIRVTPVLQPSGKHALQAEIRDDEGKTKYVLLEELIEAQT